MGIRLEGDRHINGDQLLDLLDDLEIDLAHDDYTPFEHAKIAVKDEDHACFEEAEEYLELVEIIEELDGYTASVRDVYLIREDCMEEEARSLAEDVTDGDFSSWPMNCIDWERAARELRVDYSEIEIGGTTYCYRD